jgi:hypothetical protein
VRIDRATESGDDKSPSDSQEYPMANREHVVLLKRGVVVWNKWRQENPEIQPDFGEADLRGANLTLTDLREANLSGSDLREATLDECQLSKANLSGADLRKATLLLTNLSEAEREHKNLWGDVAGAAEGR